MCLSSAEEEEEAQRGQRRRSQRLGERLGFRFRLQLQLFWESQEEGRSWRQGRWGRGGRRWGATPILPFTFLVSFPTKYSWCLCVLLCPNKEEEKPKESAKEEKKEEKKAKDDSPRPRPLHRTCSLFMRSIAPTISKAEIIAVSLQKQQHPWLKNQKDLKWLKSSSPPFTSLCLSQLCRRYPGFLRVCLSDPHPERRLVEIRQNKNLFSPFFWSQPETWNSQWWIWTFFWNRFFRRCWVTFDRSINIKEVCWNLQNIRVSGIKI